MELTQEEKNVLVQILRQVSLPVDQTEKILLPIIRKLELPSKEEKTT